MQGPHWGPPKAPGQEVRRLGRMNRLRDAALPVGVAIGVLFTLAGIILGIYGLVGLGVVLALVGYSSHRADS